MGDVDKLQEAEEKIAQMRENERRAEEQAKSADLAKEPVEDTADRPRRSAHIRLKQIVSRDNIRKELTEVHEMAVSIRERGLITPLMVRPDDKSDNEEVVEGDEKYVIVAGHRRHAALCDLHEDGEVLVPCEVISEIDEAEAFALMLVENEQRVPLEPLQAARAARHLLNERPDMTATSLARSLGLRPQWLVSRFKLLELPESVQERLEDGDLSFTVADLLRRAQGAGRIDGEEVEELAGKVAEGEMNAGEVRQAVSPPSDAPNSPPPKTVHVGEGQEHLLDEEGNLKPEHWDNAIAETVEQREQEAKSKKLEADADDFLAAAESAGDSDDYDDTPFETNSDDVDADGETRRVHSSADDSDEENPLRRRLHAYAVGRMLREWASDEYLTNIGVDRDDAMEHAESLNQQKRNELLYHLSAALMSSDLKKQKRMELIHQALTNPER